MAVVVSFIRPSGIASVHAPGIGECRASETITVPGTTTAAAQNGEIVIIASSEADIVLAAHGPAPDAAATASTTATSAGYPIPSGGFMPVVPKTGDKINVKALA